MNQPNTNGHFIFREISSTNDLLAAFRLRYNVYRNSRLSNFCPPNSDNLDVDPWDACSRHFGLFDSHGDLAASLRVITTNPQPAGALMSLFANYHDVIDRALTSDPPGIFPIVTAFPQSVACQTAVEQALAGDRTVVETGRLVVTPEKSSPHLVASLGAVMAAIGFFGKWSVDTAFHTCNSSHKNLYTRLGLSNVPGTSDTYWSALKSNGSALMATPDRVPRWLHLIVRGVADRFDSSGHVIVPAEIKSYDPVCSLLN